MISVCFYFLLNKLIKKKLTLRNLTIYKDMYEFTISVLSFKTDHVYYIYDKLKACVTTASKYQI